MLTGEHHLRRRVSGHHDLRLDGIGDLLVRARGARVLDVGCNRGMAGYEFAVNGASLVHGCDNYERGIMVAREVFVDVPNVQSCFEVVDLTGGAPALRAAFGAEYKSGYDIVLLLAIYHKLKRVMAPTAVRDLLIDLGKRANRYVGWRGYAAEVPELDEAFRDAGLKRVQYSEISETICPAAIWRR